MSELAGRPQTWHDGPWAGEIGFTGDLSETGYGHTSEQVAAIRPSGPGPLLGYHDAVAERTADYLRALSEADLNRVVDRSYDPPVTAWVRLVSVINDNLQHSGQARYVRGLIERRATP